MRWRRQQVRALPTAHRPRACPRAGLPSATRPLSSPAGSRKRPSKCGGETNRRASPTPPPMPVVRTCSPSRPYEVACRFNWTRLNCPGRSEAPLEPPRTRLVWTSASTAAGRSRPSLDSATPVLMSRKIALRVFGRRNHDVDSAKDHARQRNRSSRRRRPARNPGHIRVDRPRADPFDCYDPDATSARSRLHRQPTPRQASVVEAEPLWVRRRHVGS